MKKIKKLIVAIMAMAMVLGMLTVSASAAEEKTVKVTVNWTDAGGVDTSLYSWLDGGAGELLGGWPGTAMTKVDDDTYTIEIKTSADSINVIPNNSKGQTADLKVDTTKGDVTINVAADLTAEVTYGSSSDAGAGVSTPVIAVAAVAVIALAGVVVCMKRRTVAE